jgi:hypothetical protein
MYVCASTVLCTETHILILILFYLLTYLCRQVLFKLIILFTKLYKNECCVLHGNEWYTSLYIHPSMLAVNLKQYLDHLNILAISLADLLLHCCVLRCLDIVSWRPYFLVVG